MRIGYCLLLTCAASLSEPFFVRRAAPSFTPQVNRFYREHRYAAVVKPGESPLVALDARGALAGAARLVRRPCKGGEVHFLRSVFVAPAWRRRGVGERLAAAALDAGAPCYAFVFEDLVPLYARAGFAPRAAADADGLPALVLAEFDKIALKQQKKRRPPVALMTHGFGAARPPPDTTKARVEAVEAEARAEVAALRVLARAEVAAARVLAEEGRAVRATLELEEVRRSTPLRVLLVQHANEPRRGTGTAPLLAHAIARAHVAAEVVAWAGRADNDAVAARLALLRAPALLWTDGAASGGGGGGGGDDDGAGCATFVVLDGTWQEARKIFRKGPSSLRAMPRVALRDAAPSAYTLRGNYGWRARFGCATGEDDDGDGAGLLCTAEAVAALLDRSGDSAGGAVLRGELARFQNAYVGSSAVPGDCHEGL